MVPLRSDTAEAPVARLTAPGEQPDLPPLTSPVPEPAPRSSRRRWTRWALFPLLPLVLIAAGYWYVTGGQVMSIDDAYVEADKVGISTDVSGIVKQVEVAQNQRV